MKKGTFFSGCKISGRLVCFTFVSSYSFLGKTFNSTVYIRPDVTGDSNTGGTPSVGTPRHPPEYKGQSKNCIYSKIDKFAGYSAG